MKNKLFEVDTSFFPIENNNIYISSYFATNKSDNEYIKNNAEYIQKFMDDGYKAAGFNKFHGCLDYKSLQRNFIVIKIARDNENDIIAISVYTKRFGGKSKDINEIGKKCIEITATTNPNKRNIGKIACEYIIREDMKMYDKFYWIECDGVIEHWCEKHGGIKIPNSYINLYMDINKLHGFEKIDEYKYSRTMDAGIVLTKTIFGFNNRETFDKLINSTDTRLKNNIHQAKQLMLNEKLELVRNNSRLALSEYIIQMFYDMCEDGISEFTNYQRNILKHEINVMSNYLIQNNIIDEDYENTLWNAKHILNTTTELKIYKLGDKLYIPNSNELYTDIYDFL